MSDGIIVLLPVAGSMVGNRKNWKKWLVVVGCFCVNFTLLGIIRSNGVLYVALLAHFNCSRKEASWPYGVYTIVLSTGGPLAGLLTHYFAIRTIVFASALFASIGISVCYFAYNLTHITIFYGAFLGFGTGLITPLTHVIVNQHFKRKRATAAGFVYAGSSIGSFLLPLLTEYFLEHYSLRGTFLLLGGVALHSLIGALLYLPTIEMHLNNHSEEQRELNPPGDKEKRLDGYNQTHQRKLNGENIILRKVVSIIRSLRIFTDVLSEPMFTVISTSFALTFSLTSIYLMVIVDFAMDRGTEEARAVFLLSVYSAGDLFGRLCTGWIADLKCVRRKYIVVITMLCLGVFTLTIPLTHTYWLLMALSTTMGITAGCNMINFSPIMIEYVGVKKLPVAMGLGLLAYGLLACLRPDLIGLFRDKTGTYDYLLYMLGAVLILGAGLWLFEPVARSCKKEEGDENDNAETTAA